ncbi:MAG: energy-coupling factor transporter transmembrane component T [Phytoplasma sp.]|uniref:energy-coupling factor transporter transmembrane component T n=1 Tax=Phytoplasma sp. TaxID=2155 RepID=UPI002B409A99|nr:energy-coupling factor transporter transmembrane component T [Phytoplasma sp.]WRH06924.1 MAG: energy-coupling factor transporter transmembrane component T [Phytoplasma sp.]
MEMVNTKAKSFIYKIHPSLKIILFLLIFKIVFSFNLDLNTEFKLISTKTIFYLTYFMFFIYVFIFLSNIVPNFFRKLIRQIFSLKFFFFFNLWLNVNSRMINSNDLSFYIFKIDTKLFTFLIIFLYFVSFFFVKRETYKNIYFFIMSISFFLLPSVLGFFFEDIFFHYLTPFFFDKKVFWNIFVILFRICLFFMINLLISKTTSFIEINDGLEIILKPLKFIKFPVEVFSLMMSLIFMSIPFLLEESQKILKSQISRGLNFYTKNIIKKVYYLISLLVPILILAFKKSFVLANAMETRGYVLGNKRTKFHNYKIKQMDCFVFVFILIFFLLSFNI